MIIGKEKVTIICGIIFTLLLSACSENRTSNATTDTEISSSVITSDFDASEEITSVIESEEETSVIEDEEVNMLHALKCEDTYTSENAIPLNMWLQTTMYSYATNTYETVYVRIVNIITYSEAPDYVQERINIHNNLMYAGVTDKEVRPDIYFSADTSMEYCIFEYEVYIPESFPVGGSDTFAYQQLPFFRVETAEDFSDFYDGEGLVYEEGECILLLSDEIFLLDDFAHKETYTFQYCYLMRKDYTDYMFRKYCVYKGKVGYARETHEHYFLPQ